MLTSARPRTLVLVLSETVIDVAMIGPTGRELGERQVVPATADAAAVWRAIEQLGEFDRITRVGDDPAGLGEQIACESQRPLRQISHGTLRWRGRIAGEGLELAITLGGRFSSSAYHGGIELSGVDLGALRIRKDKRLRDYLAPRVFERKGVDTWLRRVTRAVDEVLSVWNPTTLYLATPPTLPVPNLPPRVEVSQTTVALGHALVAWANLEDGASRPSSAARRATSPIAG